MSRLVAVSNRVADLSDTAQAGGLAVAMGDALKDRKGLWFGWNGDTVRSGTKVPPDIEKVEGVTTVTLPMTRKDYNEFYAGFSNRVLWPLLHYRLDLVEFQTNFLQGYKRVNSKFAAALQPHLKTDDTIWVHDYHLFPLGAQLRGKGHRQKIGFFLHIPFPPPEILFAAPQDQWLIRSLMAYDLIGFQSHVDLNNFFRCVEEYGGTVSEDGTIEAFGMRTRAGCFPIGIDVDSFAEMARDERNLQQIRLQIIRQRTLKRRTIIGVDRLDYTKGLPERMRAFERLLQMHPEHRKAVTLMQIAPPTRSDVEAYAEIRHELETLSGAVNGEFADFDWVPLRYIHRSIPRPTLAALFRHSEVGFVTPLRDGMNLVAKEYVAAQDESNPGVLILSKFAGAAETMQDALIVNPYDLDEMGNALDRALTMPLRQRKALHRKLLASVRENDVRTWRTAFLSALADTPARTGK